MNRQTIDVDLLFPRRLLTRRIPILYGDPFYERGILLVEIRAFEADGDKGVLYGFVSSFNHVNHAWGGGATFV